MESKSGIFEKISKIWSPNLGFLKCFQKSGSSNPDFLIFSKIWSPNPGFVKYFQKYGGPNRAFLKYFEKYGGPNFRYLKYFQKYEVQIIEFYANPRLGPDYGF